MFYDPNMALEFYLQLSLAENNVDVYKHLLHWKK